MKAFTELELAVLNSIFSETPELQAHLERQLAAASVAKRENSGAGFFTTMTVGNDVPLVSSPRALGNQTQARVAGLEHGLGFVLFMEKGRLHMLEGFTWGAESTASLDLAALEIEVYREPVQRRN